MRAPRILAVTVSAVLGVGLGVTAGMALDRGYQDPLGLGAPMVNQPCQPNQAVLILASSDTENGLGPALSADSDARYLRTASSCQTAWRPQGKPSQAYVVYLGPFGRKQACATKMTAEHRGDQVTMLHAGDTATVECLCYVAYTDAPILRPGQEMGALDIMYLNALQRVLITMERRPDVPPTNDYDPQTEAEVKQFQQDTGLPADGGVDTETWKRLQQRGCQRI